MKRIIYILTVILLVWFISCKCNKNPVHKTMDKSTEKVLMNPNPPMRFSDYIVQDNSNSVTISNSPMELRAYYKEDKVYVEYSNDFTNWKTLVVFQQEPIHDTVYLKSKSKILDEPICDTCPKIEIPLIDKH